MANESNVRLTISFIDPSLDDEEKDDQVLHLLKQIKQMDEVEKAGRVIQTDIPEGSKSITGYVVGKLWAFVKSDSMKQVSGFLGDRLLNKTIEVEAEANGKKIKVKAKNSQELEAALQAVQEFIKN